jgi:integrase
MPVYKRTTKTTGRVTYWGLAYNKYTGRNQYVGSFSLKKDADSATRDLERQIRLGYPVAERKEIGFTDLYRRWLDTLTVRPNTMADYENSGRHLCAFFRNYPASQITKEDVQRLVAWAVRSGLGPYAVRKMVMKVAVDWGYVQSSPTAGGVANLPALPRKRIQPLEPDEIRALIAAADPYWRTFLLLVVSTGLRRAEAFGLTLDDVDLRASRVYVRHQLIGGKLVSPKTRNAIRQIPIPEVVVQALRFHLAHVPPTDLRLVFPTPNGCPVSYSRWYKSVWAPTVERSGLRSDLHLHDLRKTFASAMARHGRTASYLQSVMGHSSPITTLSYYTGVYGDEAVKAVGDLEDWLSEEHGEEYGGPRRVA